MNARLGGSLSLMVLFLGVVTAVPALAGNSTYWQLVGTGDWFDVDNWTDGVPVAVENTYAYVENGGEATIASGSAVPNCLGVGYWGVGTVHQTGGTCTVGYGDLNLGYTSGSTGHYILDDGLLHVGVASVGTDGTADVVQNGGRSEITILRLGQASGTGSYELHETGVLSTAFISLGEQCYGSQGTFKQTGGRVELYEPGIVHDGNIEICNGQYEFLDGEIVAAGLVPGYMDGKGKFLQTGGTADFDWVEIGDHGSSGKVQGVYELGGTGKLSTRSLSVGCEGTGVFLQTGGIANIEGELVIGDQDTPDGVGGTLEISGGELAAETLRLGRSDDGVLKIVGASASIEVGVYLQNSKGTLISAIDATGISALAATGTAQLDGGWNVLDEGAGLGRFDILTATGGVSGTFDSISLPGPDWNWGIENGETLWVNHTPEPATLLLLGFGALGILSRRRARRGVR